MGMYTIIIALLGALLGWVARDTWGMWRREVRIVEEVREVVQCRSCNKLRKAVESAVLDAERRGSAYPVPMIGNGNKRRVHWEMLGDIAPAVGNPATKAARASPPPH